MIFTSDPKYNSQESKLVENIIKQEVKDLDITKSDCLLRATNWSTQPTLMSLNDIVMKDINYQPQQLNHIDIIAFLSIGHVNIFPVIHSTKCLGHITAKGPPDKQEPSRIRGLRQDTWYLPKR